MTGILAKKEILDNIGLSPNDVTRIWRDDFRHA